MRKGAELPGSVRLFETLVFIAFTIAVTSYFLTNPDIFTSFIIPKIFFYVALTLNFLFLGIGLGFDLLIKLPEVKEALQHNFITYIAKYFLELSCSFFLFLIAILETSKTNMYQETSVKKIVLTIASIIVGLIVSYRISQEIKGIKILYNSIFSAIALSLIILVVEANTGLVFATMYLFFCAAFLISNIALFIVKYRHIFKRKQLTLPIDDLENIEDTANQNMNTPTVSGFTAAEQTIVTQEDTLPNSGVEFLSNDATDSKKKPAPKKIKKTLLASEESSNISLVELKN